MDDGNINESLVSYCSTGIAQYDREATRKIVNNNFEACVASQNHRHEIKIHRLFWNQRSQKTA